MIHLVKSGFMSPTKEPNGTKLRRKKVMKDTYAKVRLTQVEKESLQEKAAALEMTVSDYIKYCCLINPPSKTKN